MTLMGVPRMRRYVGVMAALAALTLGACSTPEPAIIEIVAHDLSFEIPDTVPAGLVRLQLTNQGSQAHAAQLYRLNDGVDLDRFKTAMRQGISTERLIATSLGGPANVDRGETGPVVEMVLAPGNYLVVCWLLDSGGTPHAFLGMVHPFEVVGEAEDTSLASPEATFELTEYEIRVPEGFDGSGTFGVINGGSEWHELIFLQIDEEQDPEAALTHLAGTTQRFPVPYANRGGISALESEGGEGRVDLDLEPGRYLVACAIPTDFGVYHATLGMWAEVAIEE
jgi:hypothetical protein